MLELIAENKHAHEMQEAVIQARLRTAYAEHDRRATVLAAQKRASLAGLGFTPKDAKPWQEKNNARKSIVSADFDPGRLHTKAHVQFD